MRDYQRAAVYQAEQLVRQLFDRGGTVRLAGTELTLPPEAHFADIAAVADYVRRVQQLPAVRELFPRAQLPVRVRTRKSAKSAHYEPARYDSAYYEPGDDDHGVAVIAIPVAAAPSGFGHARWAERELVVLHELAHHVIADTDDPGHGPTFTAAFAQLAGVVMGPEAGLTLRITYLESGVDVG